MTDHPTAYLQRCLDRLHHGDESARGELLAGVCDRLARLTHVMLADYPRLRRWEESGDVLQNALIRLHRALQTLTPPTLRDFYRLATLQIRRELLDLVRHYYGPEGAGVRQHSRAEPSGASGGGEDEPGNVSLEPSRLLAWSEFHQQVDALPEEEREVFDLVWYQGLSNAEAADLLAVCPRTVKRRWQAACLRLHEALGGNLPGV
jgi:RNA polymerase sigma-70 factor (ECF subfamily)